MESPYKIAGIDVHKKMLAVVVANARDRELDFECRRFGTTVSELRHLSAWLRERDVQEIAMESTPSTGNQYGWRLRGNADYIWRRREATPARVGERRTSATPNES